MGRDWIVSTGAVSSYPAPTVKNLVHSWQIVEVLQLQLQKHAKRWHLCVCRNSWTFTHSSKTVD